MGNEVQLGRANTSLPTPKMHLSWHGRSIALPGQLSRDGRVGRAHGGFLARTENATTEGFKHQAQQPDKAILHLNVLVLPLQVDFGLTETAAGLRAHISKLPSSNLYLQKLCLGKGFWRFSGWDVELSPSFSLKQRLCLHWCRQKRLPCAGNGGESLGNRIPSQRPL